MMQPRGQEVALQTGVVRGLAIAQLVIGCLCIILGIVAQSLYNVVVFWLIEEPLHEATGLIEVWTPIPFAIAGILGILAANQRSSGLVNSHLVMSFLSTIAAFVLFVCACIYASQLWTHIILAVLSFTEFVLAIMSAVYSGTCCRTRSQGVAGPQNGLVAVPPGHMVYQQPLATQQVYQPWVVQPWVQPAVYPATYSQNNVPPVYPASYAQDIVQDIPDNKCETPPYHTEQANEPVQPLPYV